LNVFNRVAMSLILLTIIVVTLLVIIMPLQVWQGLQDLFTFMLQDATARVGSAIAGFALIALCVLLLMVELRPAPRQSVVVAQLSGGAAEISTESVALRLKRVAESVNGVREAVPHIRSRSRGADISVGLVTAMDLDIPQKTEEVIAAIRDEAENRMGVPVRSLRVTVKHSPKDTFQPAPSPGPVRIVTPPPSDWESGSRTRD
jgi:uncharacterized alkaline shock family protein YloU